MNVAAAVKIPVAIGMLATIALSSSGAAVAHADPTSDFLGQVRAQGIGVNQPDAAVIRDAQEVCDMLDYQEGAYQYLSQHSGLDRPHAAMFLRDSVTYYCPQFAFKLGPQ
jgi:hypothetical protein